VPSAAEQARSRAEKLRSWRSLRGKNQGAGEKLSSGKQLGAKRKSELNKENLANNASKRRGEHGSGSGSGSGSSEAVAERLVHDANTLERAGKLDASLSLLRNASLLLPTDVALARQVRRLQARLGEPSGGGGGKCRSDSSAERTNTCPLAAIDASLPESTRVLLQHLNTADLDVLMSLRGIGVKKARRIVDHRKETGFFTRLDDLREIGFRDKSMSKFVETNATTVAAQHTL
jgi:Helix-hairpin-helix motif